MSTISRNALPLAALVLLLLSACGSSGGNTTISTAVFASPMAFEGSYRQVGITGTAGGPEEMDVRWGTTTVTGDMTNSFSEGNFSGVVAGGIGSVGSTPYAVEGDRQFTHDHVLSGQHQSIGGISEDGNVAALASIWPKNLPAMNVFIRRGEELDDSVLKGDYFLGLFGAAVPAMFTRSGWGTLTLDGAGGGSASFQANVEGVQVAAAVVAVSYNVAPNGDLSMEFDGSYGTAGAVASSGEFAMLGGGTDMGEDPAIFLLVRKGSGFSDASLDGPYFLLGLSQEIGTDQYTSTAGSLLTDGAGGASVQGYTNHEGSVSLNESEAVTTSVAADGALSITTSGGDSFVGSLSSEGRFGVLAGPTAPAGDPGLFLLIR